MAGRSRRFDLLPSKIGIIERKNEMTQRTWLITGVNSGFGRLMTEALLERGDRVAGTVRKLDTMDDLKAKYGDRLWLANLDMTDLRAVRSVVEKAFAELGTIDVIVSNAGYGFRRCGRTHRRPGRPSARHKSLRADPAYTHCLAASPRPGRRADYRPVHLWRPGSASGRLPLPCEQVGTGRFLGFDRPGTRSVQD